MKLMHDEDSRRDPKVRAMLRVYGAEGFGMLWLAYESQLGQGGVWDKTEPDFWVAVAEELLCSPERAQQFITQCITDFRLFRDDGKRIWSERLVRDLRAFECRRAAQAAGGAKGAAVRYEREAADEQSFAGLAQRFGEDCVRHYRMLVRANYDKRGARCANSVAAVEEWMLRDRAAKKGWFEGQQAISTPRPERRIVRASDNDSAPTRPEEAMAIIERLTRGKRTEA